MRTHPVSFLLVVLAGYLIQCSLTHSQSIRRADSTSLLRGKPVEVEGTARRRYEEARKLGSESLRSVDNRDRNAGDRGREDAASEGLVMPEDLARMDVCDVIVVKHLDECACYYAKILHRMNAKQEETCKAILHEDFDPMEGACRYFVDKKGTFKIKILQKKMKGLLQSCSFADVYLFSVRRATLTGRQQLIGTQPQIRGLLGLLRQLNTILSDIFRPPPTRPSPGSRRLLKARVHKGYSQKAARLMVYNNITAVPVTQSS